MTDHGDEDGVVLRDTAGRPLSHREVQYSGPTSYLPKDGELWTHAQDAPDASVWGPDKASFFRVRDLRRMGFDPAVIDEDRDPEAIFRAQGHVLEYTSGVEDGLYVVAARTNPAGEFRWWIAPERGWNIVRSAVIRNGQIQRETRLELAQFDDIWFPQRVEFTIGLTDSVRTTTITLVSAEFNHPHHPQSLTPADIGIEPGSTLHYKDPPSPPRMWDGQKAVPPNEFFARMARGEVRRGPTVTRELGLADAGDPRGVSSAPARTGDEPPTPTTRPSRPTNVLLNFESQWETYTRQFIIKHKLDDEPARQAWAVCRDCQKLGREYLERRRADIVEWQRRQDGLREMDERERAKRQEEPDRRQQDLAEPLDRIFHERLKPRLDHLAPETRKQSASAARDGPVTAAASRRPA